MVHTLAQDEAILRDAGFADVSLFYAAFTWRGWIRHRVTGATALHAARKPTWSGLA